MAKRMDPKLVAAKQQYEVRYFARKHDLSTEQAKDILAKAGPSRKLADDAAEKLKVR